MDNMEFWNALRTPPKSALKKITGGRLIGMTDIKPIWRLQVITELFGACGKGWKYTIDKLWVDQGNDPEKTANALVSFYYKDGDEWSEPIPGIGGSSLVTVEKKGAYTSDECYKMAVTDALSVALKSLGVAADIYMGLPDSKYPGEAPIPRPPISGWTKKTFGDKLAAIQNAFIAKNEGAQFDTLLADIWGANTVADLVSTRLDNADAIVTELTKKYKSL